MLFSEPKIPQLKTAEIGDFSERGFSALQRAENSSIATSQAYTPASQGFSALQRAENSSIRDLCILDRREALVSVLFSEPKIPQCGQR